MSTQHTPGPWSTDGTKSFYVLHNGDFVANASTAANARLIAAAPQMLEALRAALEPTTPETEGEQLRDQIAEAIAAATGEPADY
jgi:hypothetical protein